MALSYTQRERVGGVRSSVFGTSGAGLSVEPQEQYALQALFTLPKAILSVTRTHSSAPVGLYRAR